MPAERSASIGAQYLEMENNFKRSVRQWAKPSPAFTSHTPRLAETKPFYTQADYDPKNSTIEGAQKKRGGMSSAFRSSTMQRPAAKPLPTDTMYDVRPTARPRSAAAAFKSTTPRLAAEKPLLPGQQALAAPPRQPQDRLHKGAVALLSKQPRLAATPQPVCTAVYPSRGTMDRAATKRPKSSQWAVSRTQQRPAVPLLTDIFYNVNHPRDLAVTLKKQSAAKAAFVSTTPRMPERKSITPPPGAYASKFISCGMMP